MDDLNVKKNSFTPILVVILLVALIGAGAYFFMKDKTPSEMAPTETSQTTDTSEQTQVDTTQEAAPVVVETKTLDIAKPEVPPPSASSADPLIRAMMAQRSLGSAEAPVKVIEYSSLTCSHCGTFHRDAFAQFKSQFIDTGKVQITFKEFPLNPPALDASLVLRCMPEDKYMNFMDLLFAEQDKWAYSETYKDSLRQYAKLGGMTDADFDSCLSNNALKEAIIGDMKAAGEAYKVQSTPSFVINGGQRVLVGNQPMEAFAEAVNAATTQAPASNVVPTATETVPVEPPQSDLGATPSQGEGAEADAANAAAEAAGTTEDVPPAE